MNDLKLWDFFTGYGSGYWQLIDIKPHIATSDYDSEYVHYKKGEIIGQLVILKKCFTPKMKPKIDFSYEDSRWLKPVSEEIRIQIEEYFALNPDYKEKFDNAEVKLRPSITNIWIDLPEEKKETFRSVLEKLPEKYTVHEFGKLTKKYKKYISKPPTQYLLNLFTYPWDTDKNYDLIYFDWELTKNK